MMKNKKASKLRIDSGIKIMPSQSTMVQQEGVTAAAVTGSVFLVLIAAALLIGAIFTYITMMSIKLNITAAAITAAVSAVLFGSLFLTKIKLRRFIIPSGAALIIFCAVFMQSIIEGCKNLINYSRIAIATSMKWSLPAVNMKNADEIDTTLFVCAAVFVLAFVICMFVCRFISFIGSFVLTFGLFEIGAAYGCTPSDLPFAVMISGWAAILILSLSTRISAKITEKSGGRTVRKKRFISKISPQHAAIGAVSAAVAVFLIFEITSAVLISVGYDRTDGINNLRHIIKSSSNDLMDYITGVDHDASLKDGKLYEMGDLKVKRRHYITAEVSNTQSSIYLRGFIGSRYDGRQWTAPNYGESGDFIKSMNGVDAYPVSLYSSLLRTTKAGADYPAGKVYLYNFRRKKDYAYITYGMYSSLGFTAQDDRRFIPKDKTDYIYQTYLLGSNFIDVSGSPIAQNEVTAALLERYDEFVGEQYLSVPESVPAAVTDISASLSGNFAQKVDYIREYLSANTEYSLLSAKLPSDTEFCDFFLNQQMHGNSAHYATAAAVLLRSAGVPARYVEGYYIPSEVVNGSETLENSDRKIDITDEHAHAWVEIYYNRYGWVPVEVTPGFYSGSFADQASQIEKLQEQQQQEQQSAEQVMDKNPDQTIPQYKLDVDQSGITKDIIKEKKKRQNEQKANYAALIISLSAVAALIAAFVIITLIRKRKLKLSLKKGNASTRMSALYRWFERLLKFDGIDITHAGSYAAAREQIKNSTKYISPENVDTVFDLFMKAGFANEYVSEDDYAQAKQIVTKYADYVFNQEGVKAFRRFCRRISFNFIKVLR